MKNLGKATLLLVLLTDVTHILFTGVNFGHYKLAKNCKRKRPFGVECSQFRANFPFKLAMLTNYVQHQFICVRSVNKNL